MWRGKELNVLKRNFLYSEKMNLTNGYGADGILKRPPRG